MYVRVPAGLKKWDEHAEPSRIIEFSHHERQESHDQRHYNASCSFDRSKNVPPTIKKKFVYCKVPPGVPRGAYVPVEFAREDFAEDTVNGRTVKFVRATVPRVVRRGAQKLANSRWKEVLTNSTKDRVVHLQTKLGLPLPDQSPVPDPPKSGQLLLVGVRYGREQSCVCLTAPLRYGRVIDAKTPAQGTGIEMRLRWLDSITGVHKLDPQANWVPFTEDGLKRLFSDRQSSSGGRIACRLEDLATEYCFDNYSESTTTKTRMRSPVSVNDPTYMTKMSLQEYMKSEDLVEELRQRATDYSHDRTPDGIDELCERSWPRNFSAEDLRDETSQLAKRVEKVDSQVQQLTQEMKSSFDSLTKMLQEKI